MRCKVCGRDYPSLYHFKTADVCISCYEGMNPDERTKAALPATIFQMTTTAFTIDGTRIIKSLSGSFVGRARSTSTKGRPRRLSW